MEVLETEQEQRPPISVLYAIELENFKSYQGKVTIGPLKVFNAVIGPNGSGKSNFMDAISFVMGEKTRALRVKKLGDLIHGASWEQPVSGTATVTAVFLMDDETEKRFTRVIRGTTSNRGATSEYKIDGRHVNLEQYSESLEKIGINVKAQNFLVFQGDVESIVMKDDIERAAIFEEISGSGTLKEEYEALKAEKLKAERDSKALKTKKRALLCERNQIKLEAVEALKYQQLRKELDDEIVNYQLLRLYFIEKEIQTRKNELNNQIKEMQQRQQRKQDVGKTLKQRRKEYGNASRQLAKIEKKKRVHEMEMYKNRPELIKSKEQKLCFETKLKSANKSLDEARRVDEAHKNDIKELKRELENVENELTIESQSQGSNIELEDAQLREYNQLKSEAQKKSAKSLQELDSINREQKSDQDKLENEQRIKADFETKIKQKADEMEETKNRVARLEKHIEGEKNALEKQEQLYQQLYKEVDESKACIVSLQRKLDNLTENLGDVKEHQYNEKRTEQKQEVVENLKQTYLGVYGRLVSLCSPNKNKHNLAITKVFGRFMDAIVVDTETTARQCIQYLKDNFLGQETFLPITYVDAKPLKEHLRSIDEDAKLLYDLVMYDSIFERVIRFVTNNTLVCTTPENAMRVAYELGDGKKRYDVVAEDGTYYQKCGFISGGNRDLAGKARRWDSTSNLKAEKERTVGELRNAIKQSRQESELRIVELQIEGINKRIQIMERNLNSASKHVTDLKEEVVQIQEKLTEIVPRITDIEDTIRKRNEKIQDMKVRMNAEEDEVFVEFCAEIGVTNIRQYEKGQLQVQQERARRRLEFENRKSRITNQLEFEKEKNTQDNVRRWTGVVNEYERHLELLMQAEQEHVRRSEEDATKTVELNAEKLTIEEHANEMEKLVNEERKKVAKLEVEIRSMQKLVSSLEANLEMRKVERYETLKKCKLEGIKIPLLDGNLDDLAEDTDRQGSSDAEHVWSIEVDYTGLPDEVMESPVEVTESNTEKNIRKVELLQHKKVNELQNALRRMGTPNLKANRKLLDIENRLGETNIEYVTQRKRVMKVKKSFEKIIARRYRKFMECFEFVAKKIDRIYKELTQNDSAQAILGYTNLEEPYLGGINYGCVPPGKRFQIMSNLSGGEKTMAALALLFAIHSYRTAPFFVLDEIDASLDNTNINKLATFIRKQGDQFRTIVITLKEEFFSKAQTLIGVTSDEGDYITSRVFSICLDDYPE